MSIDFIGIVFFIIYWFLNLIFFCLIASFVLNLLISFNIVNTRNSAVWQIADVLDRISAPVLEPFRRLVPSIGGIDISYILAGLTIKIIQGFLLPAAEANLYKLFS